jgi:hypothetical protein
VVERCRALADEVRNALARVDGEPDEPEVVDAVWRGEALGTLLWALDLVELPEYDDPFDHAALLDVELEPGELRDLDEIVRQRDSARLWHWRARTTSLQADRSIELPERWSSFEQLIAATAMRGYELGLLPPPARGDFRAFGKDYRHLSPEQQSEALSIAAERHHALAWVTGAGSTWDDVPLDT